MKKRPFRKWMLLSYEPEQFQALNHPYWVYILTIRVVSWWGLRDRTVTQKVDVPFSTDVDAFYKPKLNVWK